MAPKDELQQRWTAERAAAAKDALENWKKSGRLEKVAFGTVDGRLDLRGLTFRTSISGVRSEHVVADGASRDINFVTLNNPPEFHSSVWDSIDFSYAEIDHLRLFLCELKNCLFRGAAVRDWRSWGTRYTDCDFSQANLQNSNIGGAEYKGKRVEYINCIWRKGNLKQVHLSGGTYRDCRFEDIRLVDEQVRDARFSNCTFNGRLESIRFDGRDTESKSAPWPVRADAMANCDFSGCTLVDCTFMGIDMRTVTLPAGGVLMPNLAGVAERALTWAATAGLNAGEMQFLKMYWQGHYTKLPSDAVGWLDPDTIDGRARELLDASLAAAT